MAAGSKMLEEKDSFLRVTQLATSSRREEAIGQAVLEALMLLLIHRRLFCLP